MRVLRGGEIEKKRREKETPLMEPLTSRDRGDCGAGKETSE